MSDKRYFNRDLSWLSFNYRVLQEASDSSLPLYERIKFLAIFSSNLDEFFRVRVGTIRSLLDVKGEAEKAQALLDQINGIVENQQREFGNIFFDQIIPELLMNHIRLVRDGRFTESQQKFIRAYFHDEVLHQLQPILLVKNKVAPFLQNGAIYLVVGLETKTKKGEEKKQKRIKYSVLKIPSDVLPRFIELPKDGAYHCIAFLDDIIRFNLDQIFTGYSIAYCYAIKLSRDADLHIADEYSGNLVEKVKKSLSKRKTGAPARFLYDGTMPPGVQDFLRTSFQLKKHDMVAGGKYHNFYDFFKFPNPLAPQLISTPLLPMRVQEMDGFSSMFDAIKQKDRLMHYPYQSYDYVLRFLNEAAFDPRVFEIKATQYRVAPDSAIVSALINAARNGKSVTVFVEVKARFDEESNLHFAQQMEAAGVKIIYSIPGLKVHAKACLVSRRSGNRKGVRQFSFLSTGNFNEKTARIYADHGFFTANPEINDELHLFFNYLEEQQFRPKFKKLLVSQFNMTEQFEHLIQREMQAAKKGKKGQIILKMNNLEDEQMIDKLYKASESGVKVDVIIRSVCCLIPGKSFSKNITVRRIVDMFLEHARVVVFHNGGEPLVYLCSADWMKRNLHHRIELGFPILEKELRDEILTILDLQWRDNVKARVLNAKLENTLPEQKSTIRLRAQTAIYQYLSSKTE